MSELERGRHGVVALGDSLVTGYGLALGGVSSQSWAGWLSWALADCCTVHAVNGATTAQVARDQLPLLVGDYRLGLVCVGANDLAGMDAAAVGSLLAEICRDVRRHADIGAVATLPRAIRIPGLSWRQTVLRTERLNELIRLAAAGTGTVLVDLEEALVGRWSLSPDRQHPTSLGHLEAAKVAAVALDAVGMRFARHLPDTADVVVTSIEQRLYAISARERLRGRWAGALSRRADRAAEMQAGRR
jgi:lysophospholipase L1-like esterase